MPPMSKSPFSAKNPAAAKTFSTGSSLPGVVGEVVCPLFNNDGSQCRKKCVGNFAYRSICEHIRRAHPDNWIPKLPASPETFAKMVGMVPRSNPNGMQMGNGMIHHIPIQQMRKPTVVRKPSKLSKPMDDGRYLDTLSPLSALDSEAHGLPSLSVAAAFAARFPNYEYPPHTEDDEDMDGVHDIDDEMLQGHTETETEDEEYAGPYTHFPPYAHIHHHSLPSQRPRNLKPKTQKRKRQGTIDSSSTSSFPSRWDELIEAATNRAVVETLTLPLSPAASAHVPSICPNTPSGSSEAGSDTECHGPKVECTECSLLVGMSRAFVCTECVSGFCEPCALENGKRGVCSECRVFGARWRRLKINVRSS